MQTSKKLMVSVGCDISNFMADFIFFVSLYFWQNTKNSFSESSPSVHMKNTSWMKRSLIKGFFPVFLWKSLRSDVSNKFQRNLNDNNIQDDLPLIKKPSQTTKNFDDSRK